MKKVNGLPKSMTKNSSGPVVTGILQKSQLKDKYVTNKLEKV